MFLSEAAVVTALNLFRLSAMEQLMFFWLKDSDAAPNIAISVAPDCRADSVEIKKSQYKVRTEALLSQNLSFIDQQVLGGFLNFL